MMKRKLPSFIFEIFIMEFAFLLTGQKLDYSWTRDNLKEMFANLNLGEQIEIDMQNSMNSVEKYIKRAIKLEEMLKGLNIEGKVYGRIKHISSIFNKFIFVKAVFLWSI